MAHTLKVDPDDDVLGWLIFVDKRLVTGFNRDLEASLILKPGTHRLVVDARGSGGTVKVSIDGGAELWDPKGGWPLTVAVSKTETGEIAVAEFKS